MVNRTADPPLRKANREGILNLCGGARDDSVWEGMRGAERSAASDSISLQTTMGAIRFDNPPCVGMFRRCLFLLHRLLVSLNVTDELLDYLIHTLIGV